MLEYDNNYIRRLIQLNLVGGLSPEEKGKLENWIDESEEHRLLFCKIKKQLSINEIRNYLQTDVEDAWKKVREKTFGAPPVRPRIRPKWLKYAAVVLPVLLSITLWYTWKEEMKNKQATVARLNPVLTLDNGEKYQLDPEEQTEIYVNEEVKAYQAGGGLIYDTTARQEENKYNRIEVPRGSEYWIVLPDGTRVWLNAATELKYPVAFHAKERRVYLKGEAYFDVSKDAEHPFIVQTNQCDIKVLGTKFNVQADESDCEFSAALLEGSIELTNKMNPGPSILLAPMQKAEWTGGKMVVDSIRNLDNYRWKEGLICFEDIRFADLMKRFEKTYDIRIVIRNKSLHDYKCSGKCRVSDGVDFILEVLQRSTRFTFSRNDDNTIIYIK